MKMSCCSMTSCHVTSLRDTSSSASSSCRTAPLVHAFIPRECPPPCVVSLIATRLHFYSRITFHFRPKVSRLYSALAFLYFSCWSLVHVVLKTRKFSGKIRCLCFVHFVSLHVSRPYISHQRRIWKSVKGGTFQVYIVRSVCSKFGVFFSILNINNLQKCFSPSKGAQGKGSPKYARVKSSGSHISPPLCACRRVSRRMLSRRRQRVVLNRATNLSVISAAAPDSTLASRICPLGLSRVTRVTTRVLVFGVFFYHSSIRIEY